MTLREADKFGVQASSSGRPLLDPTLDIIPIHVIADSANKAELLNGTLRARGLAVKPLWLDAAGDWPGEDWPGSRAELVFYFADTDTTTLDQAVRHAEREEASLVVVARANDPKAAANAIAAGADDWVRLEDTELLAEVALRERRRHQRLERLREIERSSEHTRRLLETQFSGSRDAIAILVDGFVTEANAACAAYCGFVNPKALVEQPFMDLFTRPGQTRLKRDIRSLLRDRQARVVENLTLRRRDGSECKVDVALDVAPGSNKQGILVRMAGASNDGEATQYLQALEAENERLKNEIAKTHHTEAGTRLLLAGAFAPLAEEQIGLPRPDSVQALVFIRPADPRVVRANFGALGTAEAGANIATLISPLIEEPDLVTRIGDSSVLALLSRPDEAEVERWANRLLRSLGRGIFEGGGHSTHLDFVAGYALVDRVRRLDLLVRQAQKAVDDAAPGTVSRGTDVTATVAIDDDSWETLIREALESHRYTVALLPIENLASGTRFWAALPRVLDRGGQEIGAELFQPPASRLDLLPVLERRLVGHALRALLTKQGNGTAKARVIVPLHASTLADTQFFDFLKDLLNHTSKPIAPKSLVLELDAGQISHRVREAERFAEQALARDCGLGLRQYAPEMANKSAELLPVEMLRMTPAITERLTDEEDETIAATVKSTAARLDARGILLIASGVTDTNTMAKLYNLGVGTVEGPAIGEPELFRSE